jgi:flavin reductase (DIM6/NTAB) family NADH-FMN oxidoreductase RutF
MQTINSQMGVKLSAPFPYVLATTIKPNGTPNAIGIGSWIFASWTPPVAGISVAPARYSYQCLEACGEFVLCFPSPEIARQAWMAGTKSGRDFDKFGQGGLVALPAKKVKPPIIEGSTAAFECRVINKVETGDHTLFIGSIVEMHGCPDKLAHLYCTNGGKLVAIGSDGAMNFDLDY